MLDFLLVVSIILNAMQLVVNLVIGAMVYTFLLTRGLDRARVDSSTRSQAQPQSYPVKEDTKSNYVVKDTKIDELPPDVIAPFIKKPPKPSGGFGSKV